MKNEQQTITPILGTYQLFHGKFHRGAKRTKFLEALLASLFMLERSTACSDSNLCPWVSYTVSSQHQAQAVWASGLEHTQPHVAPIAKGSVGTWHVANVLRAPPQRNPKFGLQYWHGLEWLQQRHQMHLVWRRGLVLRLPESPRAMVGHRKGIQGKTEKPNKLEVITCFTMSKALKLISFIYEMPRSWKTNFKMPLPSNTQHRECQKSPQGRKAGWDSMSRMRNFCLRMDKDGLMPLCTSLDSVGCYVYIV